MSQSIYHTKDEGIARNLGNRLLRPSMQRPNFRTPEASRFHKKSSKSPYSIFFVQRPRRTIVSKLRHTLLGIYLGTTSGNNNTIDPIPTHRRWMRDHF